MGDWVRSFVQSPREAILTVGVIVGNPFLTNEGSFVPSPRGGYLIPGELIQSLSVF